MRTFVTKRANAKMYTVAQKSWATTGQEFNRDENYLVRWVHFAGVRPRTKNRSNQLLAFVLDQAAADADAVSIPAPSRETGEGQLPASCRNWKYFVTQTWIDLNHHSGLRWPERSASNGETRHADQPQ